MPGLLAGLGRFIKFIFILAPMDYFWNTANGLAFSRNFCYHMSNGTMKFPSEGPHLTLLRTHEPPITSGVFNLLLLDLLSSQN